MERKVSRKNSHSGCLPCKVELRGKPNVLKICQHWGHRPESASLLSNLVFVVGVNNCCALEHKGGGRTPHKCLRNHSALSLAQISLTGEKKY